MPNIDVTNIGENSARAVIEDLFYTANYYHSFEVEVWNYSFNTYYNRTISWTDSSTSRYYSYEDIYGLSSGTGYGFKAFVKTSPTSGRTHVGNYSFYTKSSTPSVGSVPWVTASASTSTKGLIHVSWGSASGATSYTVTIRNGYSDSFVKSVEASSSPTTVSGLQENTYYRVIVTPWNGNVSGGTEDNYVTTHDFTPPRPVTPSFSQIQNSEGSTSVIAYWGSSSNTSYYIVRCYRVGYGFVKEYETSSRSQRFDNLILGERYYFSLQAVGDGGFGSWVDSETIQLGYARPDEWTAWYKYSGNNFDITASEWNDFCARINLFRRYKSPNLGNASFTSAVRGNNFRATQFNQAVGAIRDMSPRTYPPSEKSTGNNVIASDINLLQISLNSVVR